MKGSHGDLARLLHIYEAIIEIEKYLSDNDYHVFMSNSMMRFACIKQMEILGEAANHITDQTKSRFPDIQWRQIIGMRNILVHEYFGIDTTLVWQIIKKDLGPLKIEVRRILDDFESKR